MTRKWLTAWAALLAIGMSARGDSPGKPPVVRTAHGDVEIFPADNAWNRDISKLAVHPKSAAWLQSVGLDKPLHPDFGVEWKGQPAGIPFAVVSGDQKKVPIGPFLYADESDPGPYPIPNDAPVEGGAALSNDGDRHVLVIDATNKKLYELFRAFKTPDGWKADSGAVWDLTSNKLRPAGWTSADAAGLPILPGLVRRDEVMDQKELRHAVRFTVRKTQRGYILPATHWASRSNDRNLPPMGMRVRLRSDFDISPYPPSAQVILRGLKTYGMILADNGGDWFVSGEASTKWNSEEIQALKRVKVRDFEVVDTGPVVTDRN